MKDRITVFLIDITINIPLRFFAFRLCRCSTVKSRSKREKLSLKTLIIPRVRLAIEFGSFFIYATILSIFVDFGVCDFISNPCFLAIIQHSVFNGVTSFLSRFIHLPFVKSGTGTGIEPMAMDCSLSAVMHIQAAAS